MNCQQLSRSQQHNFPSTTATMPPRRLPDLSVQKILITNDLAQRKHVLIAICKHCGGYKKAKGTTRERDHCQRVFVRRSKVDEALLTDIENRIRRDAT